MDETKGKILIINTSGDVTGAIEPALRSARLASVSAASLGKAVEYLQSNSPSVILMDFDGPANEHVIKACQLIKRIPRCKKTEIYLLVSDDTGISDVVKKASANGYILKPISVPVFMKWLRENPDVVETIKKIPTPPAPAKPVAPTPPAPAKPVAPTPPAPAKPVAPTPPAPAEPVAPTPPAPAEPVAPTPPAPAEPVAPTPPAPAEPVAPTPPAPAEPVAPTPPAPAEPVAPTPPAPAEPVAPSPPAPAEPVAPIPPAPAEPVAPSPPAPAEPVAPTPPAPVEPVAPTPPAPAEPVAPTPPAPSDDGQIVLLIGECVSLQELKDADTKAIGLEFSFASTMADGAAILKELTPKAIVIDFDLSDVPGGQACSILKQIPQCKEIPITMIGDEESHIVTGQLANCGASGYLKKPFSTLEFLSYLSSKNFVLLPEALVNSLPPVNTASPEQVAPQPEAVEVPDPQPPAFSQVPPVAAPKAAPQAVPVAAPVAGDSIPAQVGAEAFDDLPDMDFDLDLPIMDLEPIMGDEDNAISSGPDNFERHLRTGPLENRVSVCLSLGEQRTVAAVPALIDLLTDGVDDMLTEACWSLGEIGDSRAIPALVEILNGRDLLHKSKAIEAIGKIGDDAAVVHVVNMMSDAPYELKIPIIRAFQKIGGVNALKALEFLAADSNYNVAKLAQEVLREIP